MNLPATMPPESQYRILVAAVVMGDAMRLRPTQTDIALKLGMSPSLVSHHCGELASREPPLIVRTKTHARGVIPTEKGRKLAMVWIQADLELEMAS